MKKLYPAGFVLLMHLLAIKSFSQSSSALTSYNSSITLPAVSDARAEKLRAREELSALLQGLFRARRYEDQQVTLHLSSSWLQDSLQIGFDFYRGNSTDVLTKNELVESVIYRFKPEDIQFIETESDEFIFLRIRTFGRKASVYTRLERVKEGEYEEDFRISAGFPVHAENLEQVKQDLKVLQK
jgi:hypothetical protein